MYLALHDVLDIDGYMNYVLGSELCIGTCVFASRKRSFRGCENSDGMAAVFNILGSCLSRWLRLLLDWGDPAAKPWGP